jgi:predicted CXXCH cytochrome family protein
MPTRRSLILGLALSAVFGVGGSAWATIDSLKSFKAAYPGKDAKAYSCKVCHQNAVGKKGDLNAYGLALQKLKGAGKALKLTVEDYKAIEKDDVDGDGVSNLDEINGGKSPGDPKASLPAERLRDSLAELVTPSAWAEAESSSTQTTEPPKAEYVGTETCAMCHAKQFQEFKQSTHAQISIPGEEVKAQGCEMCHGPGSLHVDAGGGRGVGGLVNLSKDPSACFECHLDKKAELRLPYHHPVLEGKMSCADCHNAHAPDVRPWSATTLKDINEACFKCHKEQRGPFVWEHEALREGCTTCHKVHGSIHDKLLLARDNNLCLRCHTQTNFPTIGGSGHGARLPQGTCFSAGCHITVHGSNFDEHLRY